MRLRALAIGIAASALACGDPDEHPRALPLGSATAATSGSAGAALAGAGAGGVVAGGAGASGGSFVAGGALGIGGASNLGGSSAFGGTSGAAGLAGAATGSSAGSGGQAPAEPMPDARFDAAWAVFKPRCGECHGDNAERFGGQDRQKAFTAALIYADEMERRLNLPRSSRDVMPPRRALSASELTTIQTWLASR